jgi:ribosomal 50S subunit-associated protein YjgA (DUF615 family)
MNKLHDLAVILTRVSDQDLTAVPLDDLLQLLEELRTYRSPATPAARRKLATAVLRNTAGPSEAESDRHH